MDGIAGAFRQDLGPRVLRGAIALAAVAALGLFLRGGLLAQEHHMLQARGWSRPVVVLAFALGPLLILFRLLLWVRYRPAAAATRADAPALTVIIPAYNEGEMVNRAIESV